MALVVEHSLPPPTKPTPLVWMAPTALVNGASPASTALSIVSDPPADDPQPVVDAGACSDPDVRNKVDEPVAPVVEPVAAMSTAEDEPGPLPDTGVPTVRITEASPITPSSPRQSTQTDPLPHASPSQRASLSAATANAGASPNRGRRATMDARASNRLSGFFSQLLTARRNDQPPPMPSPGLRERSISPPISPTAQTFTPPPRPTTPPPCLPPPTLAELGLSLSVLTPSLNSAQYATPPTSGTFLAPHYLLLCHAQGLDVFPLVGPPAAQPYALVRRVAFKSVIVMEERGVLVAIAGRRDGVRVYALEEVRRAVEWRLELEIKREAESTRRSRELATKGKSRASVQPTAPGVNIPASSSAPSALGSPQPAPEPAQPPLPPPPSYASTFEHRPLITRVSTTNLAAVANAQGRTRGGSLSSIVGLNSQSSMHALARAGASNQQKPDWGDVPGSDDEALVAAGPEASAALDERTSAGGQAPAQPPIAAVNSPPLQIGGAGRRATVSEASPSDRSATLSSMRTALAHSRSNNLLPRAPTLQQSELGPGASDGISFAEMLRESRLPPPDVVPNQAVRRASVVMLQSQSHPVFTGNELDQVNEDTDHPSGVPADESPRPRRWSFVAPSSASLPDPITAPQPPTPGEQRPATLPALPPLPLPSSPSVISRNPPPPSPRPGSHRSTRSHPLPNGRAVTPPIPAPGPSSRRRLLPKLFGAFGGGKKGRDRSRDRAGASGAGLNGVAEVGSGAASGESAPGAAAAAPKLEYIKLPGTKGAIMIKAVETAKKSFLAILCGESGEKVELFAGTYRTALGLSRTFILPDSPKSLELQLQGDDLVEVFLVFAQNVFGLEPATVRVREVRIGRNERRAARRRARAGAGGGGSGSGNAPTERHEVEPTVVTTTVSVGTNPPPPAASGTGSRRSASLARRRREVSGRVTHNPNGDASAALPPASPMPVPAPNTTDPLLAEEMAALTTAQAGAYTTFQQLSFAPAFPLATIADDYIIPPTYLSFCEYRDQWEPDAERVVAAPRESDESEIRLVVVKRGKKDKEAEEIEEESPRASGSGSVPRREDSLEDDPAHALQFAPPPQPTVVKWFYLDPKGVVQGPWKPSIMQNWLREGYLPPELPVRRAHETEYTLLRDLRMQVDDPSEPFKPVVERPPPPPPPQPEPEPAPEPEAAPQTTEPEEITTTVEVIDGTSTQAASTADPTSPFGPTKALLKPISLLAQPRHFGPPALFYCSRGGHSTTVVDPRGRAVLKGRVHWSSDNSMGDIQRVEAFDVGDGAVLVALRQGGIEATDVGQALLEPADESRTALPNYKVVPGAISRRSPYVWRLGTSVTSAGGPVSSANGKRRAGASGAAGKKRTASSKQNGASNVAIQGNDSGDESDVHIAPEEEVIFLAREKDNVYVCERSAGKFRLLRLSKTNPTPVTGVD